MPSFAYELLPLAEDPTNISTGIGIPSPCARCGCEGGYELWVCDHDALEGGALGDWAWRAVNLLRIDLSTEGERDVLVSTTIVADSRNARGADGMVDAVELEASGAVAWGPTTWDAFDCEVASHARASRNFRRRSESDAAGVAENFEVESTVDVGGAEGELGSAFTRNS